MANIKRANTSGITKSGVAIPDVPDAPTIGAATNVGTSRAFNNGSATVAFTAAATGGTSTTFTATSTPGSLTASGAGSPLTVTGLQSATSYTFAVTGTNASATGAASAASSSITATTVPETMSAPTATNVGTSRAYNNGAASVAFTAPATGGSAITGYTVTSNPSGFTGTGSSSPITVTGLASNTAYTYTITATNANGTSTASSASASVTATTVPQAPTIGSATAGSGSATVAYTAGATGGAAVSTFTATSSPGGLTGTGASPITVSGLTAGTAYTFTVTATNANGTSAASGASNSVTPISYFVDFITFPATTGNNYVRGLTADSSGNIYAAGPATTLNMTAALLKTNSSGTVQWSKRLGTSASSGDYGLWNGHALDSSGNSYTAGYTIQSDNEAYDIMVAKYDTNGSLQWQKKAGSSIGGRNADSAWGVVTDSSSNMYVMLDSQFGAVGGPWCSLVKFDSSGTLQWQKKSTRDGSMFGSIGIDSSANIYTSSYAGWVTKWTSAGAISYQRQISFAGWWGGAADSSGNFVIAGSSGLIKLDTSGNISWQKSFSGLISRDAAIDSSGNIYVVGYHGNNPTNRGVIIKYNSSGTLQWQRQIHQTGNQSEIHSVTIDPASGAVVVGISALSNGGNNTWVLAKLPADGSKTGTIAASGHPSFTYEASTLTESNMTASLTTPTQTVTDGNLSFANSSLSDASLGLSATTTNI